MLVPLQVAPPAKPALQQALAALQARHCEALRSLGEMLQGAQSVLALQQEQHRAAPPSLKVCPSEFVATAAIRGSSCFGRIAWCCRH